MSDTNNINADVYISAKNKLNIEALKTQLLHKINYDKQSKDNTLIVNVRHANALNEASHYLQKTIDGLDQNLTNDFLAFDIKEVLFQLGLVTGEVVTDDLLENIFRNFCIGK